MAIATAPTKAAKAAADVTLEFTAFRETPGTVVFEEAVPEGADPIVGTLYVKKKALAAYLGNSKALRVTIAVA